jgi:hypothetical protein
MGLVYLDSSNLSVLATALTKEPRRFERFLDEWRARGSELCVTRTHLLELRANKEDQARAERYQLLAAMLPISSDIRTRPPYEYGLPTADREIVAAMAEKGMLGVREELESSEFQSWLEAWCKDHVDAFPARWEHPNDAASFRATDLRRDC